MRIPCGSWSGSDKRWWETLPSRLQMLSLPWETGGLGGMAPPRGHLWQQCQALCPEGRMSKQKGSREFQWANRGRCTLVIANGMDKERRLWKILLWFIDVFRILKDAKRLELFFNYIQLLCCISLNVTQFQMWLTGSPRFVEFAYIYIYLIYSSEWL